MTQQELTKDVYEDVSQYVSSKGTANIKASSSIKPTLQSN